MIFLKVLYLEMQVEEMSVHDFFVQYLSACVGEFERRLQSLISTTDWKTSRSGLLNYIKL